MKKLLSVVIAGLLVAGTASAADYNFVEGRYATKDFKTANFNSRSADMYGLKVSKELGDHFYVAGDYMKGMDSDLSQGAATVTVGAHGALTQKTDIYGQVSGSAIVADRKNRSTYNYSAETGLRYQMTPRLELRGGVVADNLRSQRMDSIQWRGVAAAEYALTKSLKVSLGAYGKEDDLTGVAGVRWYF